MSLPINRRCADEMASNYMVQCSDLEDVAVENGAFDHVVTDPPYAERVDRNARRGKKSDHAISEVMPLGFDPATAAKRALWARWIATATRGWAAVFSDHESSMDWAQHLERAGLEYVRCALWVRTWEPELTPERPRLSGAPQFTGAYPAVGHEVIVLARKASKVRWLGHGKAAVYTAPVVRGDDRMHPTQKPVSLMQDILRDFVKPGQSVCDPFVGSGSTMVAAKLLGMPAFGIDNQAKYRDYAARRVAGARPL